MGVFGKASLTVYFYLVLEGVSGDGGQDSRYPKMRSTFYQLEIIEKSISNQDLTVLLAEWLVQLESMFLCNLASLIVPHPS